MSDALFNRQQHRDLMRSGIGIHLDSPQLFISGDVEADGWAGYGSMLSIGSVATLGETFYIELQPLTDLWIDHQRQFCEDHGLERDRLKREGVPPLEAIEQYCDWVNAMAAKYGKPPVLSAFNAGYDHGFIQLYCLIADIENPLGSAPYDIKSRALGITGEWDWRLTSKGRLPEIILPEGDFTHNALGDSIYQQEMDFALSALAMRGVTQ